MRLILRRLSPGLGVFLLCATAWGQSDLTVSQTGPGSVVAGATLTYSMTVTNGGPAAATLVTATDVLPSGVAFVPAGSTPGCVDNGGTVSCALGTLASGATTPVLIVARTSAAGTIRNVVGVIANEFDPNIANNSPAPWVTTVAACASVNVSPASLPGGSLGGAYSQTLRAAGGTAPYTFSLASGSLPTGLVLSSAGVLSGSTSSSGNFTFTVRAVDANNCTGTRAYTLLVCGTVSVSPATLASGAVGTPYSRTLSGSGGTGSYTFTLASGALPAGLSLSPGGVLSGTPSSAGTYSFTLRATDAIGCSGLRAYAITVCPIIGLSPATLAAGLVGSAYSQTLTVNQTGPYTFSLASGVLPAGLTLSSGGVLSGTPSAAGASSFVVRATAANGCAGTAAYTVVVSSPTGFYTMVPCRAVDTRNAAGTYGGPALPASGARVFPLAGRCGVPASAKAVAVNLTVVGTSAAGNVSAYPSNIAVPGTSTLNFGANQTRANNAVIGLAQDGTGGIAIFNASAGLTHVIVDVVGYFQ